MSQEDRGMDARQRKIAEVLQAAPPSKLPPNFAIQTVEKALERRARRHPWRALLRWPFAFLSLPRPAAFRPAWQLAWGLALCLASAAGTWWGLKTFSTAREDAEMVWVHFAVQAPGVRQVALAGNFNAWNAEAIKLEDPEGDGTWHIAVPLKPGVYQYMFVLDGKQWIPDPLESESVDDGFGQQNSLMRVSTSEAAMQDDRRTL